MKILIDMNLSPDWVVALSLLKISSDHWSTIGNRRAEDEEIFHYARENDFIVLSHDLDFSAILASTRGTKPSVIQLRTLDLLSEELPEVVSRVLRDFRVELENGALIVIEPARTRVRILPL
ncbi:MAG: DUF5615 family PIN-like protein [Verrucomicrobiota bacterium]